tara:strand:+ start:6268 stop:6618 length:351 start_codon:yes stop_codon:yes gene_type:complete
MKKILLALGFVTACAPAHADIIQINVPCDPAPEVMRIMLQYKNALLLQGTGTIASKDGKNFTSGAQIFLNQDTGTLAFVLSFPNGDGPMMSCLIVAGAEWEPYGGPQPWDEKKEDL